LLAILYEQLNPNIHEFDKPALFGEVLTNELHFLTEYRSKFQDVLYDFIG
jgi:hypothetical protein